MNDTRIPLLRQLALNDLAEMLYQNTAEYIISLKQERFTERSLFARNMVINILEAIDAKQAVEHSPDHQPAKVIPLHPAFLKDVMI